MATQRAFIGLGSNVGDRLAHLRRAVAALHTCDGTHVVQASPVYETDPVGPPQPDYLNAAVEISTDLEPSRLLDRLKEIEREAGRTAGERWGPREVDLDLLLYGSVRLDDGPVRIPHPEMVRRGFVLVPLADIAPDVVVAGAGSVRELLEHVGADGVRPYAGPEELFSAGAS